MKENLNNYQTIFAINRQAFVYAFYEDSLEALKIHRFVSKHKNHLSVIFDHFDIFNADNFINFKIAIFSRIPTKLYL